MTDTAPASTGAPLLLDQQRLFDALDAATSGASDPKDIRTATVNFLTEERRAATAAIEADFERHPRAARDTVEAYAQMTDGIVRSVLRIATTRLHPSGIRTEAERFAVLAVGGYGRAEMAPHSDVDLLFLTPYKVTPWAESVIESMLYMLWDLKLKVGHSSRTLDDCIRLGREDITIRTALLEHRCVGGDDKLAEALSLRLHHDLFEGTEAEFIEAKLEERSQRHRRQGGQRYVLEPNVKEGKGGLRDLQTLYWIGKYIHHVDRARELMEIGAFSPEEYETFHEAENYLWAVRCHLHLISGRASDQLTFDMQVEVAERMGYRDLAGRRAVEVFIDRKSVV